MHDKLFLQTNLYCTVLLHPSHCNRSAAGHLDFNPGQLKGDSTSELILCLSKNRAPHLTKLMWYTYMKDISNQQHTFNNVEIRIKVHYTYKSSLLFFLSYPSARAHFFSILPKTKLWGGGGPVGYTEEVIRGCILPGGTMANAFPARLTWILGLISGGL